MESCPANSPASFDRFKHKFTWELLLLLSFFFLELRRDVSLCHSSVVVVVASVIAKPSRTYPRSFTEPTDSRSRKRGVIHLLPAQRATEILQCGRRTSRIRPSPPHPCPVWCDTSTAPSYLSFDTGILKPHPSSSQQ